MKSMKSRNPHHSNPIFPTSFFMMVLGMIVFSFLVQYSLMSYTMTSNPRFVTNSLGKFYSAAMMAFLMGWLEVLLNILLMKKSHQHPPYLSWIMLVVLTVLSIVFYLLYRYQVGINQNQYMREMIEHHSMAIQTSKELLKRNDVNPDIRSIASSIVTAQTEEISTMKRLLQERH